MDGTLRLYHAPNTRSSGALALLEEIGQPYALHVLDMKAGENRAPAYLAVNPLGKVPALVDRHGTLVTEQVAIFLHLADSHPAAGLAPAPDDPGRGRYLRWMAFYAASFEPAVVDAAMKRDPAPQAMSPYGSLGAVLEALRDDMLAPGPFVLGERFSAADLLWGAGLSWTMAFGLVPAWPAFAAFAERVTGRPAWQRMRARDAALEAEQAAARRGGGAGGGAAAP